MPLPRFIARGRRDRQRHRRGQDRGLRAGDRRRRARFAAEPVEIAFTVAGGVLRAPPVTLENPRRHDRADLQADLNTGPSRRRARSPTSRATRRWSARSRRCASASRVRSARRKRTFDSEPLAQFLTQRALEIEQARVEAMQAALLEKQRLRREVRYYAALQTERDVPRRKSAGWRKKPACRAEEEARLKREAEEKPRPRKRPGAQAEEKARLEAEAEAQAKAKARAGRRGCGTGASEADATAEGRCRGTARGRRGEAAGGRARGEAARCGRGAEAEGRRSRRGLPRRRRPAGPLQRDDDRPGVDLAPAFGKFRRGTAGARQQASQAIVDRRVLQVLRQP